MRVFRPYPEHLLLEGISNELPTAKRACQKISRRHRTYVEKNPCRQQSTSATSPQTSGGSRTAGWVSGLSLIALSPPPPSLEQN